jgi:hypothetical protein
MAAIAFDTLKFANRLKAVGVPDKQAEAQAEVLSEALEVNLKDLVTKDDLAKEIEFIRRDLREMEQRLTIKLGGMLVVAVGVVAALVKLL